MISDDKIGWTRGYKMTDKELDRKFKELDELYGVNREFEGDDCEYEVTKKGMLSYLHYPCYEKWIPFLYGGTIEQYLNYDRALKNGYRGDQHYKGAFLLRNNENTQILTADILTSIGYLFGKCFPEYKRELSELLKKKREPNEGEEIKKLILSDQIDIESYKDMLPYFKAFALVYYWSGNMMPVPSNPRSGMNGCDHWHYKIEYIQNCFRNNHEGSELNEWKNEWNEWIKVIKQDKKFEDFISDNYLEDCLIEGKCLKDINETNSFVNASTSEQRQTWLVNSTKLIIQRSYRIENNFRGSWDEENIKRVQQLFEVIFNRAGLDYEKNKVIF